MLLQGLSAAAASARLWCKVVCQLGMQEAGDDLFKWVVLLVTRVGFEQSGDQRCDVVEEEVMSLNALLLLTEWVDNMDEVVEAGKLICTDQVLSLELLGK